MKKICIIFFLSILAGKNYGQTYYPFPTTTGIWTHEWLDDFWNPTGLLSIDYLGSDTVIGAYTYKKLFVNTDYQGAICKGAIRENNKVIYFYSADSLKEYLLYDFSVHIGDTILGVYDEFSNSIDAHDTLIVQSSDTIQLQDGNFHRRWNFNACGEWIEGVGSIKNLLDAGNSCSVSGGWRLDCFVNDFGIVYYYGGPCTTGVDDLQGNITSLKIFPNPTNDFIKIEGNFSVGRNSGYEIRDNTGKIIQEKKSIPTIINIKELAQGIYFISFQNNGKIETRKFIKN